MFRLRRALLLSLVVALPLAGCTTGDAPAADAAASAAARPVPPPPDACARLTVEPDDARVRYARNTSVLVRFENCGSRDIILDDGACGGLAAPRIEGPVDGHLAAGAIMAGRATCPPDAPVAPLVVPPNGATARRHWWDGTMYGGCVLAHGDAPRPCPPMDAAPAGAYRIEAIVLTADRLGAWRASATVELAAWNDTHETWTRHNPEWREGPAVVTWDRAGANVTVRVAEGTAFATDGRTYLYATRAGALDPPSYRDCAADFSAGTWVLVKRPACMWIRHPDVVCVRVAEPDPCDQALRWAPGTRAPM